VLIGTEYVTLEGTTTVAGSEAIALAAPGVVNAWPAGTAVRPVAVANDASAQTALATALGGGLSGIATRAIDDASIGRAEADALAASTLTLLSGGVASVAGVMVDAQHANARNCWPGASVVCTVTSPVTVSGTYRIQQVMLTPITLNGSKSWTRTFQAAPVLRGGELLDTLGQVVTPLGSRFGY
jgi:hypothetical protein